MNTAEKLEKTKMENTIPTKDRIIAWPRMGRFGEYLFKRNSILLLPYVGKNRLDRLGTD